jgi:hypothetical protein
VLTRAFRSLAGVQAIVLLLLGWVLLARASVVTIPDLSSEVLTWATWGIVALLTLNTVANLSAPYPLERWVMGSITLVLVGLSFVVALRGSGGT